MNEQEAARPEMSGPDLAKMIDHTLLKPTATESQIQVLCDEAKQFGFAAVCVNPLWIPLVARLLDGTGIAPCSVVGFPLGSNLTELKVTEAIHALDDGALEIDMVLSVGALKEGRDADVESEIEVVVRACHSIDAHCKVILEMCFLNEDEKVRACQLCVRAGADFVKTSTGFGPGGATVEDVALMAREVREAGLGIKASGGIRSREDALRMIAAGATRLGTSSGIQIVRP